LARIAEVPVGAKEEKKTSRRKRRSRAHDQAEGIISEGKSTKPEEDENKIVGWLRQDRECRA